MASTGDVTYPNPNGICKVWMMKEKKKRPCLGGYIDLVLTAVP